MVPQKEYHKGIYISFAMVFRCFAIQSVHVQQAGHIQASSTPLRYQRGEREREREKAPSSSGYQSLDCTTEEEATSSCGPVILDFSKSSIWPLELLSPYHCPSGNQASDHREGRILKTFNSCLVGILCCLGFDWKTDDRHQQR